VHNGMALGDGHDVIGRRGDVWRGKGWVRGGSRS
jgi:hypothetical protein